MGAKSRLRQKMFDEQKGICWICNEPMLINVSSNNPLFATFDHIKHKSRGGRFEEDNLKLAHKICNGKRGNGQERDVKRWQGNPLALPFSAAWLRAKGYM